MSGQINFQVDDKKWVRQALHILIVSNSCLFMDFVPFIAPKINV